MKLITGNYGPFRASKPLEVPLWLAVYLKKRQNCKIDTSLYSEEFLKKKVGDEKTYDSLT